jgi:hypothetical protein
VDNQVAVTHCDTLIGEMDWSKQSYTISRFFDLPGDFIIEGVQVGRAIRKWLRRNPDTPLPVDTVYYFQWPHLDLTKGQTSILKGCQSVWWKDCYPFLNTLGVHMIIPLGGFKAV